MKQFFSSRLFRLIISISVALLLFFLCPPCFSRVWLGIVLGLLLLLVNLDQFIGRFASVTWVARILVGGLFIFSGFIKANDPVGFGYKMKEYFEVFEQGFSCDMKLPTVKAAGIPCEKEQHAATTTETKPAPKPGAFKWLWDFSKEHSLAIAIFICAIEMVLGVFLLLGFKPKLTLWLLLGMIVFFSFLTFYSACCDKVKSCGCFGDFLPLTPWQSFWKDLILLILITLLFAGANNIQPVVRRSGILWGLVAVFTFISFWIPVHTSRHLPFFDFRAYKIGTNLFKAKLYKNPAKKECIPDTTLFHFYYKKGDQVRDVEMKSPEKDTSIHVVLPDSTWEFFCNTSTIIFKGNCNPTIQNFFIRDMATDGELTDSLLLMKGAQFFLVMYDVAEADRGQMKEINAFYEQCQKNHIPFNAIVHSDTTQIKSFRKETKAAYPIYNGDDVELKTMIRANPGLIYLQDGTVKAMWNHRDIPTFADFKNEYPVKQ